jgi:hypothetical protein
MYRVKQGFPPTKRDLDLINSSIEVLRGYIPAPPDGTNGGKSEDEKTGRLLILRKRLELIEKSF